ncbi:MAG: ATP-dependent Clp protease proteolytic subunit [Clostridia bacterium]|nr:ATP-dependent Clp protease proteolytic subunit [Clostridia bacterium]
MPMVPTVIEQTPQGERAYDLFSRLLNDRIIILAGPIDDGVAATVVGQMLFLEAQDPDKEIYLYINTYGGQESSGLSIYDTVQYIKCPVVTICMGMGGCIGALLVASGTAGKRYALPNTEFLLEQPHYGARGQASNIKIAADHVLHTRKRINEILAKHTGRTVEEVAAATERENFLTAEEALAFGIIDEIFTKKA